MEKEEAVLFIAPLPPPATGASLVSHRLLSVLGTFRPVVAVDYSKSSLRSGITSLRRIAEVFGLLARVLRLRRQVGEVYLVLSQSLAGNLRDLAILALCRSRPVTAHLHGGGIATTVFARSALLRLLNRLAYRHVERVLVLSASLTGQFAGIAGPQRVTVLPNFADTAFMLPDPEVRGKFAAVDTLRFVYLGGMIESKGIYRLLRAFATLPTAVRSRSRLTFVGRFPEVGMERRFAQEIVRVPETEWLGPVDNASRADFLKGAHALVLPTRYPYEGQPLAILEAYAAGCVVLSTRQGGISDVFADRVNGFDLGSGSVSEVQEGLMRTLHAPAQELAGIASANAAIALDRFSPARFDWDVRRLFGAA